MKKESKAPASGTKDAGGASKPKNRGGNFSVTTILLSAAFAAIAISVLKVMLRLLSAKMDSRAETFGSQVTSIALSTRPTGFCWKTVSSPPAVR